MIAVDWSEVIIGFEIGLVWFSVIALPYLRIMKSTANASSNPTISPPTH